jgi:hypothetical protein
LTAVVDVAETTKKEQKKPKEILESDGGVLF